MKSTRITKQRQLILEEVKKSKSHPTADMIYESVRKELPSISLGTVYRNLERLAEQGMINKLYIDSNRMRFDADLWDHSHIQCIVCGNVDDINVHSDVSWEQITTDLQYQILGHKVEFIGKCPKCINELVLIEEENLC